MPPPGARSTGCETGPSASTRNVHNRHHGNHHGNKGKGGKGGKGEGGKGGNGGNGTNPCAGQPDRTCCAGDTGKQWCQGEACEAVPSDARATLAECAGRCDYVNNPASHEVCGQPLSCPDCSDCQAAPNNCDGGGTGSGPAGFGIYCVKLLQRDVRTS